MQASLWAEAPKRASEERSSPSYRRKRKRQDVRLDAGPAGVTASRDHWGMLGRPIRNRQQSDLRTFEYLLSVTRSCLTGERVFV